MSDYQNRPNGKNQVSVLALHALILFAIALCVLVAFNLALGKSKNDIAKSYNLSLLPEEDKIADLVASPSAKGALREAYLAVDKKGKKKGFLFKVEIDISHTPSYLLIYMDSTDKIKAIYALDQSEVSCFGSSGNGASILKEYIGKTGNTYIPSNDLGVGLTPIERGARDSLRNAIMEAQNYIAQQGANDGAN